MSKPVILLDQGEFVGLSGAASGDVLTWDGTAWVSSPGGEVGTVTSVALDTASTGLTVSGGTTQTITESGTFTLGGTLGAGYGGTGLGAPVVGDAGKVLTATAGGGYELTTNGAGTVTSITAGAGLSGGTITGSGTISMPNVGTAASYGSASSVPVFTTDDQGRVTAVTETPIDIAQSAVINLVNDLAGKVPTGRQVIAGAGLSGGGTLANNVTLSLPNVGTAGLYGSAASVAVIRTDDQGRVFSATTTAIGIFQSQVSGLTTALDAKADKTVQLLSGAGIDVTGAGTLAGNSTISLKSEFAGQADQGSATKTVTITTDSYGRVTALAQQNIAGLAASVITTGQLGIARGGTGIDASGVLAGAVLMGEVGGGALALHKFSGDATMLGSGAVTVTGLRTNPVSATVLGAVDAGKALVWSGSEWAATNIQGGGGGGGLIYFMNYAASSPYPLSTVFDQHAGWNTGSITVQNNATGTTLATFNTAAGVPGIEVIPAGLWDVNFYAASADANANEVAVRFVVRVISGVIATDIATSDYVYLSDPAVVNNYIATVYVPATDVALTDRLQIVLEGRRFTGDARTITAHFGTGAITHTHTTINAPGGTGLVKVVDGFIQTPATLLVNADVSATAAVAVAKLAAGTNSYVLTTVAGVPTWSAPAATGVTTITGTGNQVLVNGGFGTPVSGAVTLTLPQAIGTTSGPTFGTLTLSTLANGVLKATSGTGSIQSGFVNLATSEVGGTLPINKGGTNLTSAGASGNLLVSDGSSWASVAMAGDATLVSSGTISLANAGSAGTYGSASAVPVFVTDAKGRVTSATNTSIAISASAITSGTLNTARGGTGVSNPSTGTLLLGAGASAMTSLSGVTGDVVLWSGSTWTASALSSNAVTSLTAGTGVSVSASTGAVTVSIGQSVATSASPSFAGLTLTGLTGYLQGNGASVVSASATIPVADVTGAAPLASPTFTGAPAAPTPLTSDSSTTIATTAFVKAQGYGTVTSVSASSPLASSGGAAPTISISGQVALANGGTAASLTATAGGSVYGTGTALAVTAAGTSGQFLQSNGASAPTWADVATSAPYDLRGMFVGNPASSSVIDRFVADRSATISTTATNHKFSAASRPSAGVVVLTVQRTRTTLGVPATVTVFIATSASTDTILNGYYPMTISAVTNGDLLENDVLEVVVQAGAVNASFATIVYTISAVA